MARLRNTSDVGVPRELLLPSGKHLSPGEAMEYDGDVTLLAAMSDSLLVVGDDPAWYIQAKTPKQAALVVSEPESTLVDTDAFLSQTISSIKDQLSSSPLSRQDLESLLEAERQGKARKTLLPLIEEVLDGAA